MLRTKMANMGDERLLAAKESASDTGAFRVDETELGPKEESNPTAKRLKRDDSAEPVDMDNASSDEVKRRSRAERKRHREKTRREKVNKGFDELLVLLTDIDPELQTEAQALAIRAQWKGTIAPASQLVQEESLLNRAQLIARTVEVLRRVHHENEQRKIIIAHLIQASRDEQAQVDRMIPLLATPQGKPRASIAAPAPGSPRFQSLESAPGAPHPSFRQPSPSATTAAAEPGTEPSAGLMQDSLHSAAQLANSPATVPHLSDPINALAVLGTSAYGKDAGGLLGVAGRQHPISYAFLASAGPNANLGVAAPGAPVNLTHQTINPAHLNSVSTLTTRASTAASQPQAPLHSLLTHHQQPGSTIMGLAEHLIGQQHHLPSVGGLPQDEQRSRQAELSRLLRIVRDLGRSNGGSERS